MGEGRVGRARQVRRDPDRNRLAVEGDLGRTRVEAVDRIRDADRVAQAVVVGAQVEVQEAVVADDRGVDRLLDLAAPGERRTSFGRRGSGLSRANSSLSLKSVLEDEILSDSDDDDNGNGDNNAQMNQNVAIDTSKLVLRRLEQRIVEKHIKTGRLRSVVSMDQFGATASTADSAAGQRRIRTSLSFGSNMSRLSLETSSSNNFIDRPSQQGGGGLRRTSLQKNDSFRSLRSSASDRSAATAGRRMLGL